MPSAVYHGLLAQDLQIPEERFREKLKRWELHDPLKHTTIPAEYPRMAWKAV